MRHKTINFRAGTGALLPLALACITGVSLAAPSIVHAQDRGRDRGGDRRDDTRDRGGDRGNDRSNDRGNAYS